MQSKTNIPTWLTAPATILLGCLGLTWIAYSNSLNVVFHFDDIPFLLENPKVKDLDWILRSLFEPLNSGRDIPLLTFYFNYSLHGLEVQGYHVVNITIHALNGYLVFLLVSQLLSRIYAKDLQANQESIRRSIQFTAIATAAIFVVHPLLSASVTYITQRSGQLATTFYMLATLSYLQIPKNDTRDKKFWIWAAVTLFCYWCAFKCKEMALTWLMIPFLYEFLKRLHQPELLRKTIKPIAFLLVSFVVLIALYLNNAEHLLKGNYFIGWGSSTLWGPWFHFEAMFRALFQYWKLLVLPLEPWMNIDHDFTVSTVKFDKVAILAMFFHLGLVGFAVFLAKKRFVLAALGIGWFYVAFGPYIAIPERDLLVEYKAYLPSIGWMLVIAELLFWLHQKQAIRKVLYGGVGVLIVLGIMGTRERNTAYFTTASVWKDSISKAPYKARTLHNLGFAYAELGHLSAAKLYFQKALEMSPGFVLARLNLSRVYIREKSYEEGYSEYRMLIGIANQFSSGELYKMVRDAYYESGIAYAEQRRFAEAIAHYQEVLKRHPDDTQAHLAIAQSYLESEDYANARKHFEVILRAYPNAQGLALNMGIIALREKKAQEAIQYLLQAMKHNPNNPDIYNNLGVGHLMLGNNAAAEQAFRKALQVDPNHAQTKQNLGVLQKMKEGKQNEVAPPAPPAAEATGSN